MPQFTFEGPNGQQHTIEGPPGATKEQAFGMLQQHLGQPQPQAAAPADDYHSQLSGALNAAMKALAPSWNHNDASYSPYKPAQPGNMPNDAVNPVGTDAQMTAAIPGAKVARMMANGPPGRLQPAPQQQPVNMEQMPTQQGIQNNIGLGGARPPTSNVADALQNKLLGAANSGMGKAAMEHGANLIGNATGIPMAGTIARNAVKYLPEVLRLGK